MEAINSEPTGRDRSSPPVAEEIWRFANCEFDELRWVLRVGQVRVELETKPLEVLRKLLHDAPNVVSKEDLFNTVWPEAAVVDNSLATAVSKLRRAIGDLDASMVVNVPRVGYRLATPVFRETPAATADLSTAAIAPTSQLLRSTPALLVLACVALAGVGFAIWRNFMHRVPVVSDHISAVAVLPFENAGQDHNLDYLGVSLADEVENSLSYVPRLSVRLAAKRAGNTDAVTAGKEAGVSAVIAGHYYQDGDRLKITMEAISVEDQRMLWRKSFDGPANNLVSLRKQIDSNSQTSIAQALGASQAPAEVSTLPSSAEAYNLYLRSAAIPFETGPNLQAISMLQRAVVLDPIYAPAWMALGRRYYVELHFANGDGLAKERWVSATERAHSLDPNYIPAASALVVLRVEQGQLAEAYKLAQEMLRRRPDSATAHFSASYVLRYAGMMPEASKECDNARWIDPHDFTWRSCALVFMALGKYGNATDFAALDSGTDWNNGITIDILLRQVRLNEAEKVDLPNIPQWNTYRMLQACARKAPRKEIAAMAAAVRASDDPELDYLAASHLAYCGMTEAAITLLSHAVDHNYCSVTWLENDPMLNNLRNEPRFAGLLSQAKACRQRFVESKDAEKNGEPHRS